MFFGAGSYQTKAGCLAQHVSVYGLILSCQLSYAFFYYALNPPFSFSTLLCQYKLIRFNYVRKQMLCNRIVLTDPTYESKSRNTEQGIIGD